MRFIGVDIGTTRIKALLYDLESQSRDVVARSTPVIETEFGAFRDADAVLEQVLGCVDELLAPLPPEERTEVAGIGITSLSEEVVLVDSRGRSIAPMPTWYNTIGAERAIDLGLDPSFSWTKLRWAAERIASEDSDFFRDCRPDDIALITTLNGYISGSLGDGDTFPVDYSHASRTGFFELEDCIWDDAAFEATGWNRRILPALVPTGAAASTISDELVARWGLSTSVSIVLAGHDHFCGAFGVGIRQPGQLFISAGTSEAHCLLVSSLPTAPLPPNVGVGRFVDGEHFYLHRQLPSGHLYRHWRGLLDVDEDSADDETEALLAQPIGSYGTTIVPGFDTDARASVLDLDPRCVPYTVLRALLEGIACAGALIDEQLADLAGLSIGTIIAAGIPSQSRFWRELRSQTVPANLLVSEEHEAAALGAALLAQRSIGGGALASPPLIAVARDAAKTPEYAALTARFGNALGRVADVRSVSTSAIA